MSHEPRALVIRTAGTNCDGEMCRAFELAGARTELAHLERLCADPSRLDAFDLVGFPGGFSYGDDAGAGRVLALRVREALWPALRRALDRGAPMIGACNGFQALVQTGLLPGCAPGEWPQSPPANTVALAGNAGARFIDRWVGVTAEASSVCVWTRDLPHAGGPHARDAMMLPIAHGEGRFLTQSDDVMRDLESRGQIALRYTENPNGSEGAVAGICDPSGLVLGLMPHPERYLEWSRHPYWTSLPEAVRRGPTPGFAMFRNAVAHVSARGAVMV